jgi:hypothetical protein
MRSAHAAFRALVGSRRPSVVVALLSACLLAASIVHAQGPWTVTVTPTMNPLPIGFCAAVQLTILDPSIKDVPRNANGVRVTMADFDMAASGASVVGRQIDATHFEVCACQGGSPGSTAVVSAAYPAKALTTSPVVPAFQRTATFTLAPAKGALNPPACANSVVPSVSVSPTPTRTAPSPQPPATAVALPPTAPIATVTPSALPAVVVPAPVVPAPAVPTPAPPPTAVALPPVAPPVTVAPAPAPNPATATPVALPPVAPRAALDTYKPGPVTVNLALSAAGSWYEPGPVTVNFGLSAQGSWYAPGPVTVTFNLSATGNWQERLQDPPPPIQQAPPGP